MNIPKFGAVCLMCLVGCFFLAGIEFEEGDWSPAVILATSMLFSAAIGSMFTIFVINSI